MTHDEALEVVRRLAPLVRRFLAEDTQAPQASPVAAPTQPEATKAAA
jgi:hypothetical protein